MNKYIIYFTSILLLCLLNFGNNTKAQNNSSKDKEINITTTSELYSLVSIWADEYKKMNPNEKINVVKTDETGFAKNLNSGSDLYIITNENSSNHVTFWKMILGNEVIVPIIHAKNPFFKEISNKGISPKNLSNIFNHKELRIWNTLFENATHTPVHIYVLNNEFVVSGVKKLIGKTDASFDDLYLSDINQLIAKIQNEPNAIGFCKLSSVIDNKSGNFINNIKIAAIDKNGNGKIDYSEDIYDNPQNIIRAAWIGKYPKALTGNISAIAATKPLNENVLNFLKWINEDGQQYLNTYGYYELVSFERNTNIASLGNFETMSNASSNNYALAIVAIIIICVFALAFVIFVLAGKNQKKNSITNEITNSPVYIDENTIEIHKGLYYDKSHTWAYLETNGEVKVGIDDFLQKVTGKLTRIKIKNTGEIIKKGETVASIIQNGKLLNIYSPVSGRIKQVNENVITNPTLINKSPYTDGWFYMIEPSNWIRETQFYIMGEKYKDWIKNEIARLKDFFANLLKTQNPELAFTVLQDGGALKNNLLEDFSPDIWEEFQNNFLDISK